MDIYCKTAKKKKNTECIHQKKLVLISDKKSQSKIKMR